MKKTTNEIITQIRALLNELERLPVKTTSVPTASAKGVQKKATGCIGVIQDLINEGFFESQKSISQVVDKLREEGQPYSRELVSMNLLNLVKLPRKILRRVKENEQWQYILRK